MQEHKVGDLVFHCYRDSDGRPTKKYIGYITKIFKHNGLDMYDVYWDNGEEKRYGIESLMIFKDSLKKELEECTR